MIVHCRPGLELFRRGVAAAVFGAGWAVKLTRPGHGPSYQPQSEMAGILRLVWVSFGDSCPYCKNLNGRTVGIKEAFLNAGDEFHPDGAESALKVSRKVRHAPAHRGCDCVVGAVAS